MVAAGEQLPKQHELAKRQYQSPIKFQCAQPPLLCMPMLFKPAFDTDKFAQYHPTTLDSNNSQVSLLSDDLGLPDLDLPRLPDGTPVMDPKDIELLPDNQVDPALAKLLGKKSNMPVWLRNTEYTELPLRQEGLEGVLRTRRRTLQEKPVPEILDSTVHVGDNETLEQGIEKGFDIVIDLDKEFDEIKKRRETGQQPKDWHDKIQHCVHPNPRMRKTVQPVGVWHVFPHFEKWRNTYVSVNFMEGNPIPIERLVGPGTDFWALSHAEQRELYAKSKDHDDSILVHLPDEDGPSASQDPDDAFTFLLPRTHRDQDPAAAEDDDPAEAEEDEPLAVTRKRQREYERVADFVVVDEVALGRKENARRLTDRDLYITMLDNEGVANYVKLEDQVHLKRKVRKRDEPDLKKGQLYVVDARPLDDEEQKESKKRYSRLTGDAADSDGEAPEDELPEDGEEAPEGESAANIIASILQRHQDTAMEPVREDAEDKLELEDGVKAEDVMEDRDDGTHMPDGDEARTHVPDPDEIRTVLPDDALDRDSDAGSAES